MITAHSKKQIQSSNWDGGSRSRECSMFTLNFRHIESTVRLLYKRITGARNKSFSKPTSLTLRHFSRPLFSLYKLKNFQRVARVSWQLASHSAVMITMDRDFLRMALLTSEVGKYMFSESEVPDPDIHRLTWEFHNSLAILFSLELTGLFRCKYDVLSSNVSLHDGYRSSLFSTHRLTLRETMSLL